MPPWTGAPSRPVTPDPHGFSEILYEFSSASANNGSGFERPAANLGFQQSEDNLNPPAPYSPYWDIATGLVMLLSRFIPIIAPIALAASLAAKKPTPFTAGTLRTDTFTFRLRAAWHGDSGRRPAVPAGGGAGSRRRAPRADPVRRLRQCADLQLEIDVGNVIHQETRETSMVQTLERHLSGSWPYTGGAEANPAGQPAAWSVCAAPVKAALKQSVVMLRPDIQWKNPVMFVVEVGTVLDVRLHRRHPVRLPEPGAAVVLVSLDVWLLLTLLFANFASALAEARGKAQADALRQTRRTTPAFRLLEDGTVEETVSTELRTGDLVQVTAGQVIPGDGEIIEGVASIDESAITGESAPVVREAGGDHSGVTGGTRVLSDRIVVRLTAGPGAIVPGPHDCPGRRRHSPAHAQRDRPVAGAGGLHVDLSVW